MFHTNAGTDLHVWLESPRTRMASGSCHGLPTKGDSHVLFTCEKGYVATQARDTNGVKKYVATTIN